MSKRTNIVSAALVSLLTAGAAQASFTDVVTISGSLGFAADNGFYRLRGQSVYLSERTNSGTTGGQLDGLTSFDSETSVFEIRFGEVFPEANLLDYLTFGYLGVVETVALVDDGFGGLVEEVVDTSIIVAGNFGDMSSETRFSDIFGGFTEAELVAALTNSFDSPEFFAALDVLSNDPRLAGDISLSEARFDPDAGFFISETIETGESLSLFAFTGGDDGDVASDIGFLETNVTRVFDIPTPGTVGVLALSGLVAGRRRR